MFFGHIAVGLAAKPVAPKAPLGALLLSHGDRHLGTWAFGLMLLLVFLLALPAAVLQLSLRPTLAVVLLLPFGNWVDRHRSLHRSDLGTGLGGCKRYP
jgi:hypothetical protein